MSEGASRLAEAFARVDRPLFIPYVMGGYPDLATSRRHAELLAGHADIIELGIPFSDPLADGPTIQAAGVQALAGGVRPDDVLDLAGTLRDGPPVAVMTYVNTILAAGERSFFEHAAASGVAGVIVPDLPVDEGGALREHASRAGVAVIALAAPTTADARLAAIGRSAEGFVYCVSVAGVTGGDVSLSDPLRSLLTRARERVEVPLVVGFGIRTPEHAREIGAVCDGVVIASELIRIIDTSDDAALAETRLDAFAAEVVAALGQSRSDR